MYNNKKGCGKFMKDIFISYNSEIHKIAEAIEQHLEKNGIDCFLDKKKLHEGEVWSEELMAEIPQHKALLFLYSEWSNKHPTNIRKELSKAQKCNIPIIPVKLDDSAPIDCFDQFIIDIQPLNCYQNDIDTLLSKILKVVKRKLSEKEKVFERDLERGIIKNSDGKRNVSFRTDTFINMIGGIYEKVAAIAKAAGIDKYDEIAKAAGIDERVAAIAKAAGNDISDEIAQSIFFDSGYESGKNFAESRTDWDYGYKADDIKRKFSDWCKFDSDAGWGRFSANLEIDEYDGTISGTICINEAFIVDNKNKRKVCSFIRGYCDGVAEVLLGFKVELICDYDKCPLKKKNIKKECVFKIETQEDISE